MKKLTIKDIDVRDKRLLIRVDFNVPLDANQHIMSDGRIRATLPTIKYAVEQGAKVVLTSHLGRPKGQIVPEMSLRLIAGRLGELLNKDVRFVENCVGPEVEAAANALKSGDVLLLENVRFHRSETRNDPVFSEQLARLGDIYVDDAFACAHRVHSSTVGVAAFFDTRVAGFLMEKELVCMGEVLDNPAKPFMIILGGAKIKDKIPLIENLFDGGNLILVGGGMAFTFLKVQGKEVGHSLVDYESFDFVESILKTRPDRILLPGDCVVSDYVDIKAKKLGQIRTVSCDEIPEDWTGLDIGPDTIASFSHTCQRAKTIVWNGPMGIFEIAEASKGTYAIANVLADLTSTGVKTIIGGGESASAVEKAGVADRLTHVSTGGGASLEFLQGNSLPGIEVLDDQPR